MKLDVVIEKQRQNPYKQNDTNNPNYDGPKHTGTGPLMTKVKWYLVMNQEYELVRVTILF